jgi:hypothetical protein
MGKFKGLFLGGLSFLFAVSVSAALTPAAVFNVRLETHHDAEVYAARLIESLQKESPRTERLVRITHIEGQKPDERLVVILDRLARAGAKVELLNISRADFERQAAELGADYVDVLTYGEKERVSLGERLKRFAGRLFGTPHGITVAEHIVTKDPDGKTKLRFDTDGKAYTRLAGITTMVANGFFMTSLLTGGMSPTDAKFLTANAILAAWVFTTQRYQRELSSFKMQGVSVDRYTLKSSPNRLFFMASTLVQEWVISGLIVSALSGPAHFLDGVENGTLSAFSYAPVEYWRSKVSAEAEKARKAGDLERAAKLEKKARRIAFVWWNIAYPVMRNLHYLFALGFIQNNAWAARLPFLTAGVVGLGFEVWNSRHEIARAFRRQRVAECQNILTSL